MVLVAVVMFQKGGRGSIRVEVVRGMQWRIRLLAVRGCRCRIEPFFIVAKVELAVLVSIRSDSLMSCLIQRTVRGKGEASGSVGSKA